MIARALRAYPTLLRVGVSEVVAYRAEFFVWVLTTNMPLVNLAIWTAVARDGPVGRFGQKEFVAYYLGTLIVRLLTSSWVVWELTMDIRQGVLATRLLRPIHPLVAYSAEHLAAIPMRLVVVSPVIAILAFSAGDRLFHHDPLLAAVFFASMAGAWLLTFLTMVIIGSLSLFVESALGVFELWLGIHALLSGYFVPLELFPRWVSDLARVLPFRYMLGFPVETLVGLSERSAALTDLGIQWAYIVVLFGGAVLLWRAGMRRFVAYGA
jgi:ABC-2 type transport system permease protein